MPKATRVSVSIPASPVSSERSEAQPLATIALFCGLGLLASLVVILMGVEPAWY